MINVLVNEDKFTYDILALMKAFYPGEEVAVSTKVTEPDYTVSLSGTAFSLAKNDGAFREEVTFPADTPRPEQKNLLKRLIYTSLRDYLDKELPWGDLSGIRPTKIPMKLLYQGKSESEILDFMKGTYLISDEKGSLCIDIAKREKAILDQIHFDKGYSIYIGIPFCPTTCLYCSFTSNAISMWKSRVEEYLNCIKKELEFTSRQFKGQVLDTIYIGGGTPTTLSAEELDRLLNMIEEYYDVTKLLEFTVEAGRADSITKEKLEVLYRHHVTRISVNPQTMNQATLDIIGRRHSVEDVVRAYNEAREVGFTNINMDTILGLPGEDEAMVSHTFEEIEKLKPDSLTVHSLALKRGSLLYERLNEIGMDALINTDSTMEIARQSADRQGLLPYYLYRQKNMTGNLENTGFAREGAFGIYNILIMEEVQPIVAIGAGTVSKNVPGGFAADGLPKSMFAAQDISRCDSVKDVGLYIEKIDEMIERKRKLFEGMENQ